MADWFDLLSSAALFSSVTGTGGMKWLGNTEAG
jgi:hypothetical protein